MKVYPGTGVKQLEGIQKKQPADSLQKTDRPKEGDKVDFSKQLQQVQNREKAISEDSDRQARLKAVKEQIASNSYAPDPQEVARSLVQFIVKGNSNG
ncbi:MAG: flagellar biosynthesis anti-sigma factor FlgM [Desulfohalobiaceae bacterium]|nr:flagellar biosynthesis anti-sigma factor FlgM [Desulfohalobiaceae bacterium]